MKDRRDSELFEALRKGDKEALSLLFLRHYDYLLHYGLKIAADHVIAEECIQELFLYMYESRDNLGAVKNVKAYLFTSIRRRVLEKIKREKKQLKTRQSLPASPDIQFSMEDILIKKEGKDILRDLLHRALNELPVRQREAIYLRYYNGLNTGEIAKVMGISKQTVLNTLCQAIKKMHDKDYLQRLMAFSLPALSIISHQILF